MNSSLQNTFSGQQIISLQKLCELMNDALKGPFELWVHDGERFTPQLELSGNESLSTRPQIDKQQVNEAIRNEGVNILPLDNHHSLVVVENGFSGVNDVALVGVAESTDKKLLRKMVLTLIRQIEQQVDLEIAQSRIQEFTAQVTNDFEELTWLRRLTAQIAVCDMRNNMSTVADAILPSLQELICAEAVMLFPTDQDHDAMNNDSIDAGSTCYVTGKLPFSIDDCEPLLQNLRGQYNNRPLVKNLKPRSEFIGNRSDLRNIILVQIANEGIDYGWLLAINRMVSFGGNQNVSNNASCLCEWEFGTFEAGLLNATAVVLGTHARNASLFRDRGQLLLGVTRSLINAIDAKDRYTCGHSDRVALISKKLAETMQRSDEECQQIYLAGLLHDIGKIGVPDEVLCKPGRLSDEEYEQIKTHPDIGYSILRHVKQLQPVLPGVLQHHESIDGAGYPNGLVGNEISLQGRILAVADAYDAMTSTRSYRTAMPVQQAEMILREGAGSQWDTDVVDAFFAAREAIGEICKDRSNGSSIPFAGDTKKELPFELSDSFGTYCLSQ